MQILYIVPVLNIWYLETLWGELFFILILNSNFFIFCKKVSNRERKMSSLQSQLHDLHKEISRRDSEITNHQQTIKMMQEKQRYLSGEVNHQLTSNMHTYISWDFFIISYSVNILSLFNLSLGFR